MRKPDIMTQFQDLETLSRVCGNVQKHILLRLDGRDVRFSEYGEERLLQVAENSGASAVYSYYKESLPDGTVRLHPLIPYQQGSLRDDFDFGAVVAVVCLASGTQPSGQRTLPLS